MKGRAGAVRAKRAPRVLVVDDEAEVGRFFEAFLREERGCRVALAGSGREARERFRAEGFDLAFLDLKLPDATGIDLLRELRTRHPGCQVVIMTGHSTIRSAVEAIRLGAYDYVEKPFDELEELERILDGALSALRAGEAGGGLPAAEPESFNIVSAADSPLRPVLEVARKIAKKNLTVLIHGPTGAGKEVLARFIHANSQRADKPFIGVNCGAFAETLLDSELFGHERGAFTGALSARRGIFELADGGTLFLDEIGEATPAIQVKLLRVLESGEFMRVGGERLLRTDVRIVAATNMNLAKAVERGAFRQDLYYRLEVVTLDVPPLRERPSDIDALMRHFAEKFSPEGGPERVTFTERAREALLRHDWPGNVREMANVMARAMALREGECVDLDVLPPKIAAFASRPETGGAEPAAEAGLDSLAEALGRQLYPRAAAGGLPLLLATLRELENRIAVDVIDRALGRTGGNHASAAKLLGVSPRVLRYYLRERGRGGGSR